MKKFKNIYSVSKTLRFELKPLGKTAENLLTDGLLHTDELRVENYQRMKKTIDAFHREFISRALKNIKLAQLDEFSKLYNQTSVEVKKSDSYKKSIESIQEKMRKEIVACFKSESDFQYLNKKELIKELLPRWSHIDKHFFSDEFKTFTTYFVGFNQNRANMYVAEAKSTAIAYRVIHENLPKFLSNINIFKKIIDVEEFKAWCNTLYKNIEEYLNIASIEEAFEVDYFNQCVTQQGIEVYNLILGGKTTADGEKIKGLNEYINLYNQEQKDFSKRIPKMSLLYKQILSDREVISYLPEKFESSKDLLEAVEQFYKTNLLSYQSQDMKDSENLLENIKTLLFNLTAFDLSKIYFKNDASLSQMSQSLFGDWSIVKSALEYNYMQGLIVGKKGFSKKQIEEVEKYLKQRYFSIEEIEQALDAYRNENEKLREFGSEHFVTQFYFKNHFTAPNLNDEKLDFVENAAKKYKAIETLLGTSYPEDKDLRTLRKSNVEIQGLKNFLDSLMDFLHFIKPLVLPEDFVQGEKDQTFYQTFLPSYQEFEKIVPLYNKVRNYITQKPYSQEKFKLTFNNSTLLNGWDVNKEEENSCVLFKKDELFYLGIIHKNHKKIFKNIPVATTSSVYQKINYKLLPGANKMLPKVFFSEKNSSVYNPSTEILRIRNHGTHAKDGKPQKGFEKLDFNLEDCHKLIDFFKESISKHPDWKNFGFKFSETNSYQAIDAFYREVENQGYNITYTSIDEDYIHTLITEGKLYFFQIYNKDFSSFSKGKKNLHTLYFEALFEEKNLQNVVYKLNGQAELFYRKKSITYDQDTVKNGHHYQELKNKFSYPIVKDKRFSQDKFLFHVPITLNFKAKGNGTINSEVLNYLKNNSEVNIIGLDRGERHLIYYSIMNQNGEILFDENNQSLQGSLNTIGNGYVNGIEKTINYHEKLNEIEKNRQASRKQWTEIQNIKNIKEGYLSQVVHKIAQLMVKYNAIVVLEDLNFGFKRGRFKVEKQVYQKFEKMLIDKLNYLVFKEQNPEKSGGLYHALQLTNKFTSFEKLGKQSGFLFYVPAWNTSKIDPTTGFVNLFSEKYETIEKAQKFFSKFDSIAYNQKENYFEFSFNYNSFERKIDANKNQWMICTQEKRIVTFRDVQNNNQWNSKEVDLTTGFCQLFEKFDINIYQDLKEQIVVQTEAAFFKELFVWFKRILQMRNSDSENDYIISPVKNQSGKFFDSRESDGTLPKDADANGAYHIAKKGLWILQQINAHSKENDRKGLKLAISNKDWLNFVQNK